MLNLVRLEVLVEHFEELGDYEMSELLLGKMLEMEEQQEGGRAKTLIPILHNLALLAEAQERRADAMRYARRAYALARSHLGPLREETRELSLFIKEMTKKSVA
jgi:hypothetical protein